MYYLYMENLTKRMNNFFESKTSIWILAGIGTIIAFMQLLAFFQFGMEINGISFDESKDDLRLLSITLSMVSLSLISLYVGFAVSIADTRGNKWATYLGLILYFLAIVIDCFAGLWMTVMELAFVMPILIYRKGFWEKERYKEDKFQFKNLWPITLVTLAISLIFFYLIVILWGDIIYHWSLYPGEIGSNYEREWFWYVDAFVSSVGVVANVCIIFRWRIAYLFWTIGKFPLFILYGMNGQYVQIFQSLVWLIVDSLTVLALTHQQSEHKKEI